MFFASIDHPGPPESSLAHGEYYVILISEMGAQCQGVTWLEKVLHENISQKGVFKIMFSKNIP